MASLNAFGVHVSTCYECVAHRNAQNELKHPIVLEALEMYSRHALHQKHMRTFPRKPAVDCHKPVISLFGLLSQRDINRKRENVL